MESIFKRQGVDKGEQNKTSYSTPLLALSNNQKVPKTF